MSTFSFSSQLRASSLFHLLSKNFFGALQYAYAIVHDFSSLPKMMKYATKSRAPKKCTKKVTVPVWEHPPYFHNHLPQVPKTSASAVRFKNGVFFRDGNSARQRAQPNALGLPTWRVQDRKAAQTFAPRHEAIISHLSAGSTSSREWWFESLGVAHLFVAVFLLSFFSIFFVWGLSKKSTFRDPGFKKVTQKISL